MASVLEVVEQNKVTPNCQCPLEVRYTLQRNDQSLEEEAQFEPTDDAVYKITVTNRGTGYAKDVKALAWLTAMAPAGETVDLPDDLRIIPHGLVGTFQLDVPAGAPAQFPDNLTPIPGDLDLDDFRKNADEHDLPFPPGNNSMVFRCNVIRFGDIPAGQTKVSCLTIISEGAPEETTYSIDLFFKFDCCELVEVPVPLCRQIEHGVIEGQIVKQD